MNETEFWFFDLVVVAWHSMSELLSDELELSINKLSHGLSRQDVARVLSQLFENGDLSARLDEGRRLGPAFMPSQVEINAGLMGQANIYFGLTSQGASRWEALAKPDWNRYFFDASNVRREGEIISSNRTIVEECLETKTVSITSVAWNMLIPWQVTYWKELDLGYRLSYTYDYSTAQRLNQRDWFEWCAQIGKWYTNPFAK